jgi:predicted MFS family arabinose efflux permease
VATPTDHDPYEALREPGYVPYIAGGVLSSVGAEIQAVAVGWELYERTNDVQILGFTGLAQFLPVLLFALPAGQAADHFNRRKMFQCAQVLAAAASLLLAWLSWTQGPVPLVFVCLVLAGTGRAFSAPARSSLVSQIVPIAVLPNAVTWNSTGWQMANVSGPALGGLIMALAGQYAVAYVAAACCSLACVGLLFSVHPNRPPSPGVPRTLTNILAGIRFVWRSRLLLAAISLDLFAVLLGGATALLPAYAKDILHIGPVGLGCLRAAPACGALLMALIIAHRPPLRRPGLALLLAVAGFGIATIGFGLSTSLPLSFIMLLLTGALDNVSVVVRGTLMQVLTPDAMRGRVAAVNSLFISSSNELGAFESGQVAAWFGVVASVVSGGVGTIIIVLVTAWLCPRLAQLGPLRELQPDDE